jgi:hypothetical protein
VRRIAATVVAIPAAGITDRDSFHQVFAAAMGFPDFYGRNMNAWIDCMTYADDPASGMTDPSVAPGAILALRIDDAAEFARRCPELWRDLVECTAFVNHRRIECGEGPVLALMPGGSF